MREIKFRAWFKNKKVMKNVAMNNVYLLKDSYWYLSPLPMSEYEPIELMQYIGLKDKNGKEIYEGDIVRWRRVLYTDCWETEVKEVQIRTCEIGYLCDIDLGLFMYNEEYDSLIFKPLAVIEDKDGFEIIGNIYENPELSEALS